jgi:DNA-binding transcriptional regulator YhcF (GntR family)
VIRLAVDPADSTPPFDQLKQQLTAAVDAGVLTPGEKLPTVRGLAAELGLAANTVARAYRELEAEGVVQTRGRSGTFVSGGGVERAAREAAAAYVREARSLGLGDDEVVALVRRALG